MGIKVKRGMKGSSAGLGERSEHTQELKSYSKKARRCEAKLEIGSFAREDGR